MKDNYQTPKVEENKVGEIKLATEAEKIQPVSREWGNERRDNRRNFRSHLKSETLDNKRVVKVTKGGRRFSFTNLVLIKDEEKNAVAFAYVGGKKEVMFAFRASLQKAQKKLITYFPTPTRTIPRDIVVKYKATKLFLKPAPPGSGIKASAVLGRLFKFLEIKDVSAKIIGSRRNKLNVIRAAFLALDKLTGKKYEY